MHCNLQLHIHGESCWNGEFALNLDESRCSKTPLDHYWRCPRVYMYCNEMSDWHHFSV